jgi:hypothetical protein
VFTDVKQKVAEFAGENAAALLTAGGVVGVVGTGVLSGRAGFKLGTKASEIRGEIFQKRYEEDEITVFRHETEEWRGIEVPKKDLVIAAAPELIPPVVTGIVTIAAIIYSNRMSAQKAAALAAAYGLAERNFAEYKAKVSEKLTGPKQDAVKDELAQEAVDRTSGHDQIGVIEGEVLCFDINAGRYFKSTVEKIRQAANTTNAEVINRGFAPVSFFYDELDLDGAPWADVVGFGPDNMLELDISTTLKGGKPCVTINFKKAPQTEYGDPKNY